MIGSTISHYKILEKLGEGGMGVVYKARDSRLDRDVAIKFLSESLSPSESEQNRFIREARAVSSLNHPSICTVHDIGQHEDRWYFVMEYVDGVTLHELAGKKDEKTCLGLVDQIAEGLAAAHAKNIVHRDIKSSNIMLTTDDRVKIMDFGLAKVAGRADLTRSGSTVGTMAYLPPEQARGEEVDHRADIYALGVVLYELLTGERPFNAPYEHALLYQVLNEPPPAPSTRIGGISPGTDAIVRRCLEKNAADRYQSVEELRSDLASSLAGTPPAKAKAGTIRKTTQSSSMRRWLLPSLSVVFVLVLLLLVGPASVWNAMEETFGLSGVPDRQHLAVLPFLNIGEDPDRQLLCDGLTETMTSKLTQLEQFHGSLWVVPASEVRRGNISSAEDARKTFGVNLVLDGSLQGMGESYRLTLNLMDAATLRQLNSAMIDIGRDNLTALHDESVIRVLEMLHVEFHPEIRTVLQSGGTTVPAAYEYYLRGRGALLRYEQEENIDDAVLSFRKALREDSTYTLAHAALGEALWRKYESGKEIRWAREAVEECERARRLDPTLAPANVTLGIVYTGTGKPEAAVPLFEAALAGDPANAEAHRGLAKAYEALGDLTRAVETYRRAVELRSDYWGSHNDLGVFYSRNSRYLDAIGSFKRVTELTPDNYRGFNNLGGMYYFLDQWAEARSMFERSYAIRHSYRTASNIGTLNYIEGRYGDAARWYEKAVGLNATDHVVTGNLASAYYWAGTEKKKALETFRRAISLAQHQLEVNPGDPETHALFGGYSAMVGDTAEAIRHVQRSLALNSQDASIMFRAGTTYEQIGDRDQALEWIEKALLAGYSVSEISNQPELRNLYADSRFEKMLADQKADR